MAHRTCLIKDAVGMPRAGVPTASRGYNRTWGPLVTEELNSKVGTHGGPPGALTLISEVRGTSKSSRDGVAASHVSVSHQRCFLYAVTSEDIILSTAYLKSCNNKSCYIFGK